MEPIYFESAAELRRWFQENHLNETELIAGFYKKGSNEKTISWSESVDEALSFGWIDGRVNSIDSERYTRRFTPRKPDSIWSNVNIGKVKNLIESGRMERAGLLAFEKRDEEKSGIYHFEQDPVALDEQFLAEFKKHQTAYLFFLKQAPSYQKLMIHHIMSDKKLETQQNRLQKLIGACAQEIRL